MNLSKNFDQKQGNLIRNTLRVRFERYIHDRVEGERTPRKKVRHGFKRHGFRHVVLTLFGSGLLGTQWRTALLVNELCFHLVQSTPGGGL